MPGILFPLTAKGDRSTTDFGKAILTAAAESLGDAELCQKIKAEKDWRHKYNASFMNLMSSQVKAEVPKALDSFRAALAKAREMDFEAPDGAVVPLETAMTSPTSSFDIATITGSGEAVPFTVPFEYGACVLQGSSLDTQLQKWSTYGCMEADCADAIKAGAVNTASVKGRTFVVIGAGSELCPLRPLLQAGATVAALATRKAQRWERLIEFARGTPGTLLLPVPSGTATGSDGDVAKVAGVDLMADTPAIAQWVQRVVKEAPGLVTIGTYLYVDGGPNVCVTVASDYIIDAVAKESGKDKVSFAWLGSPGTAHVVPLDIKGAQETAFANASWWQKMSLARAQLKSVPGADGRENAVIDGLSIIQGPNYAFAQHLRQWRAMLLHSEGFVVSTPMAPACRTESVIHNGTMKAALDGMYYLPPLEAFHPETGCALLFAILVSDLSEPPPALASPLELFTRKSFHSGIWRCPFSFESAGKVLFILGKVAGQSTPNKS